MSIYKDYGIYGIRNNVNQKIYVGKTATSFGDRRDCHIASLRGGYHINPHLQRAWDKYGEENFEFIILESCVGKDPNEINSLERMYIKRYKEQELTYNISDGGDGGYSLGKPMSDETKRKIGDKNRINMLGRRLSNETREKMSTSQKKRYSMWTDEDRKSYGKMISECASGYSWTEDSKHNFSELQKTKPNGAKYNIDTVHKIRHMYEVEGKSISEIAKDLEIHRHTVYQIATYRRWKYV